jgi:prepilin-type N-terminal cleavage/methylation domain-containing protein
MRRRAFTLVELLTVMGILAILMAIFAPAVVKTRGAATQFSAMQAIRQLMPATSMYMADADDRFPIAFHVSMDGPITWYGGLDPEGKVDPKRGLLAPYYGGRPSKDPTHRGKPWKGDLSGFGYNWGFLGSSYYYGWDRQDWYPTAMMSELSNPSHTIAFATSAYYYAGWNNGDGLTYDYGYIDPPFAWNGAPTVDCRHMGEKRVVVEDKSVEATGNAIVVHADGSAKTLRLGQIKNSMFERQPRDQ